MLEIVTLKHRQRQTHIMKNGTKRSLCGRTFKREDIKCRKEGHVESASCEKCVKTLNANLNLFLE